MNPRRDITRKITFLRDVHRGDFERVGGPDAPRQLRGGDHHERRLRELLLELHLHELIPRVGSFVDRHAGSLYPQDR